MKTETLEAKLAAKLGIQIEDYKDDPRDDSAITSREAESVLLFLKKPEKFAVAKHCGNCEEVFLSSISAVGYCTDTCRKVSLAKIGIKWDKYKTQEERWGSTGIPLVITPAALKVIHQLCSKLLESQTEEAEQTVQVAPVETPSAETLSDDYLSHPTLDEDDKFLAELLGS